MEKWEKIGDITLMILLSIIGIFMCIIIAILIDFHNDYQCSTTNSLKFWETHNCDKYCGNREECEYVKQNLGD